MIRADDGRTCPQNCPDYVWCNWGLACYWHCNADPDEEEPMTTKYIAFYGAKRDVVYAESIEQATEKAQAFGRAAGLDPEAVADPEVCFAHTYDMWRARDLNLLWLDERETGWIPKEARS